MLDDEVRNHHNNIEMITTKLCEKTQELQHKDSELLGHEVEIRSLNEQIQQFESHVAYLKSL